MQEHLKGDWKMGHYRKILSLVMAFALIMAMLSGCGNKSDNNSGKNNNQGKTPNLLIFSHGWEAFDGAEKDSVWRKIEKRANVTFDLSGVSLNSYIEKINMMVNTNEAPDVFFYLSDESYTYAKWAEQGMLLNFDDYVKDDSKYPNIYRLLNSVEYRDLKYNGMHTLLPSIAPENNWAIYIRQDWLDNLGLKQPITLEEFAAVMESFTTQDPDRNGKNDTYGLSSCKDSFWFMPFFAAFCPKDDWNYSADGKSMEYYYYTSGYKEYLRYMANLYSKGCIVKDYYTKTDDMKIEDFASGKAGILIHNADTHIQNIMSKVLNANLTVFIPWVPGLVLNIPMLMEKSKQRPIIHISNTRNWRLRQTRFAGNMKHVRICIT